MNQPKNEQEHPRVPADEEKKNWVERWRQPTGSRATISGIVVFVLINMVCLLVYETGGTSFAWLHLMYLPIILAAAGFGLYGGIAAALVAGLALGPFMPMNVVEGLPQTTSNWLFRTVVFLLVGGLSGLVSTFLNRQINRLKATHQHLLRTHEELKSAQMQLIQTAKLESIGRLAAGVAHEVKNPLAVIQLGVDYLTGPAGDKLNRDSVEAIEDMANAVQRADTIIKGLLNFSRSEPLVLVPVDLNGLLEESLLLVKHELSRHHVSLEKHLAGQLPKIELDRNKLEQVFINVFMNAIQAMGENGVLSVTTFLNSSASGHRGQRPRVVAQVEDTGPGIPPDKMDKLFEPFFTTKGVGKGTGLGLSVSRKIIELHRGTITIANRNQVCGVRVTMSFPIPEPS